ATGPRRTCAGPSDRAPGGSMSFRGALAKPLHALRRRDLPALVKIISVRPPARGSQGPRLNDPDRQEGRDRRCSGFRSGDRFALFALFAERARGLDSANCANMAKGLSIATTHPGDGAEDSRHEKEDASISHIVSLL